jgi:hypothetical protein
MTVNLRCNSITATAQGDKIVTTRTFVSTDLEGNQLNADVTFANYQDSQTGDATDTSIALNQVVAFTLAPVAA